MDKSGKTLRNVVIVILIVAGSFLLYRRWGWEVLAEVLGVSTFVFGAVSAFLLQYGVIRPGSAQLETPIGVLLRFWGLATWGFLWHGPDGLPFLRLLGFVAYFTGLFIENKARKKRKQRESLRAAEESQ
jgi:hypothetical protein